MKRTLLLSTSVIALLLVGGARQAFADTAEEDTIVCALYIPDCDNIPPGPCAEQYARQCAEYEAAQCDGELSDAEKKIKRLRRKVRRLRSARS